MATRSSAATTNATMAVTPYRDGRRDSMYANDDQVVLRYPAAHATVNANNCASPMELPLAEALKNMA